MFQSQELAVLNHLSCGIESNHLCLALAPRTKQCLGGICTVTQCLSAFRILLADAFSYTHRFNCSGPAPFHQVRTRTAYKTRCLYKLTAQGAVACMLLFYFSVQFIIKSKYPRPS